MPAVWLEVDPAGMRVERTAVVEVPPDGDGWTVETLAGTEHVDERGEGSRLVPLDAEMAAEFEDRGTSFVVRRRSMILSRHRSLLRPAAV
jgi:hypothetical protein